VAELTERARVLIETLERDVHELQADQAEEQRRIEQRYAAELAAVESATDRLGHLQAAARQLAAQKGKLPLLESAIHLGPTLPLSALDEPRLFERVVADLEREMKAAQGITGAIRLPEIGRLLSDAALVVARLQQVSDRTKQQLVARTERELQDEGKEARASFEIGLGVLQRDLELLDRLLGWSAKSWSDPAWEHWEPIDARPAAPVVRLGDYVDPNLPDVAIPCLFPATGAGGLVIEGGAARDQAIQALRDLVLRLLVALPPGAARFTFIDPKGLGESVAPFLGLAEYDADLVAPQALSVDDEIEEHLASLTRHIEGVTGRHLQGRYASLDELHDAAGEIVEPYRYLVVLDHPHGFTDRAQALLRTIVEAGPRCGVMVLMVKQGAARGRFGRDQAIPGLPVVKAGPDGLTRDLGRSGTWPVRTEDALELVLAEAGEPTLFERITTATGALARQSQRAPVSIGAVFDLLARAQRRRVRDDLPHTTAPVDPGEPSTWWTGDAQSGLGLPFGRTADRGLASLWFDRNRSGAVVVGAPGRGVSAALQAMLTSAVVLYPPDELQLLLVGLGERRELAPFGAGRLPHAVLVATEAERELGATVLDAATRELDRRQQRFDQSGTGRLGLAGHRARTGDQLARLLLVIDGVGELLRVDDPVAQAARQALRRLAEDGPGVGVHLLLADRCATQEALDVLLDGLPSEVSTVVTFGSADDDGVEPGDAVLATAGGGATRLRTLWLDSYELHADLRDLRRLADERGAIGGPQVVDADRGADLAGAPLDRLGGADALRLWLGEPCTLGAPVEVELGRQEGSNLLAVVSGPGAASGLAFAALVSARVAIGARLEPWVLDLGPLDEGFGAAVTGLPASWGVSVGRKRTAGRVLAALAERVARHREGETDDRSVLLVVNGLPRGVDVAADGETSAADLLLGILQDGPAVGIHTVVVCDSLAQLDQRLGPAALGHFASCVASATSEADSLRLLDSPYAASLRRSHALLADEAHARLVKFRPYALPPSGWSPPAAS
jgi:hypothetical protein